MKDISVYATTNFGCFASGEYTRYFSPKLRYCGGYAMMC